MNFFITILIKKFSIGFDEIFLGKLSDGSRIVLLKRAII